MLRKALALGVVILLINSCSNEENKVSKLEFKTVRGVKVETVKVEKSEVYASFPGRVIPKEEVILSPKVAGYLLKIERPVGSVVKKGETLAIIDSKAIKPDVKRAIALIKETESGLREIENIIKEVKAKREAAKASYILAEKTYNRFKKLLEEEAVSKQKFDEVKAQFEVAKANLKAVEERLKAVIHKKEQLLAKKQQAEAVLKKAKAFLSFTYLKSPVNGVILQKLTDEGNLVSPGVGVLKVGSYPLEVKAFIDSSLAEKLKVGDSLAAKINGKSYLGKVKEIDKEADPISHKVSVKLVLEGSYKDLIPGMYATVYVPIKNKETLTVPKSAIYKIGALEFVYVIGKDGTAHLRYVKTGKSLGNQVEILSGLYEGERIAVSNLEELKDGAKVEG